MMGDKYAIDKITSDGIKGSVSYLNSYSLSKAVKPLNDMRLHAILETTEPRKQDGGAILEKTELLALSGERKYSNIQAQYHPYTDSKQSSSKDLQLEAR
jgi:hypothetical protein